MSANEKPQTTINFRADARLIARLDALVEGLAETTSSESTRSDVIRGAILLGLPRLAQDIARKRSGMKAEEDTGEW